MKIEVRNSCAEFNSYRAARVKSLFNADSGANFNLTADLPIDDPDWRLGLIVGPSGSGKTSMGRKVFGPEAFYEPNGWPSDKPIIDAIAPKGDFNAVTAALAAVGLGSVPSWLRPYPVLSNGEKFRADLARIVCEAPARVVVDEFTSVVDRQIAKFGALAFQKSWKRTSGQCILLSCHYDIVEWLEPDWVFDTSTGTYSGRGLWRRPRFDVKIWETNWRYWHLFEPHYYLKLNKMIAAQNYVGVVEGELVAHLAVGPRPGLKQCRGSRMVVMPEWQGAGIGMRFLNTIAQAWLEGNNRYKKSMPLVFHTSHPGLCEGLRRDKKWAQISAILFGANKRRSAASIAASAGKHFCDESPSVGYGGHMRAVQGFRYDGVK